ncbi:hypothetical protein GF377_09200 [candidate division GN15 bacterium]|nr:hypothetical protein [candidate division GN15 bacterium]
MADTASHRAAIPGWIAVGLITVTTALWIFWGTAEMFYEGWGQPFPAPLAYLIPGVACLILALAAVRFPAIGGCLLIVIGAAFTAWWISVQFSRGADWTALISMFPVSGMIVFTGVLFLVDSRYRRRLRESGLPRPAQWWRRNLRYLITAGVPLLTMAITAAANLPTVLGRDDDGYRGQRVIEGNGVTLVWAPEGPGWNWKQDFGGYPSWNSLALYGAEPVGLDWRDKLDSDSAHATTDDMRETCLCAYLSDDGTQLLDTAQHIWRMPTTLEVVRSLVRDGEHVSADWDGETRSASFDVMPDKETPLWDPTAPPVYYWTADELSYTEAYYVSYNGLGVTAQNKRWGNPRHGYRCVREVRPGEQWDSLGVLIPPDSTDTAGH